MRSAAAGWAASRSPLLQALQVGDERVRAAELGRRKSGIWLPGLTCCESMIQLGRLGRPFGDGQRAERRAARHVGQVGADVAARGRCRGSRGSSRRRRAGRPASPRRRERRGGGAGCRLLRQPGGGTRAARLGEDVEAHVRVLQAAELGALRRGSGRRRRRRARSRSCWPGIVSIFRFSSRHPEAVDHVVGAHLEPHRRTHRDVDLVRGHRRRARVAHLPPPLVADHARRSAWSPSRPAPASS